MFLSLRKHIISSFTVAEFLKMWNIHFLDRHIIMYGHFCALKHHFRFEGLCLISKRMNSRYSKLFIIPKSFMYYYFYGISRATSDSPITGSKYYNNYKTRIKYPSNSFDSSLLFLGLAQFLWSCYFNDKVSRPRRFDVQYVQRTVWYFSKSKKKEK